MKTIALDWARAEAMSPFSANRKVSYYGNRTQFDIRTALFVPDKFHYSGEALITKSNASLRLPFVERIIHEAGECRNTVCRL